MSVDLVQEEAWQSRVFLQERDMFFKEEPDFILEAQVLIEDRGEFY